jgi:hypothetical protein
MMDYMLGGKHVFIFAGYPDQMDKFLLVNEGLARRLTNHHTLPDYTPEQLAEIVILLLPKTQSWTLDEGVKEHLASLIATHFPPEVRAKENGMATTQEIADDKTHARHSLSFVYSWHQQQDHEVLAEQSRQGRPAQGWATTGTSAQ